MAYRYGRWQMCASARGWKQHEQSPGEDEALGKRGQCIIEVTLRSLRVAINGHGPCCRGVFPWLLQCVRTKLMTCQAGESARSRRQRSSSTVRATATARAHHGIYRGDSSSNLS